MGGGVLWALDVGEETPLVGSPLEFRLGAALFVLGAFQHGSGFEWGDPDVFAVGFAP